MYNRYIPEDVSYTPVEEHMPSTGRPRSTPQGGGVRPAPFRIPDFLSGTEGLSGLLKKVHLDRLDSGDILLLLIALYLLAEGDEPELAIALGLTVLMGLGEEG